MASSIETTSTTTTLKNNGNTYATVDTNDDVTITNDLVVSGTIKTDDATQASSTSDGSLQTDGGLSVTKDAVLGNDIRLLSDASRVLFGTNLEVQLTHVHNVGLSLNSDLAVTSLNGGQLGGNRNRIINGDMKIDQRNAAAAVTITTGNQFSVDRFQGITSVSSKYSLQQTTTAAVGFVNSIKALSLSAYTVGVGEQNLIRHHVEGLNMGDLNWGTSDAKTVTLSFQVRSSLTGTFGGSIFNYNGSRSYPFSYSIGSADTWTTISITIAGDTSGTWLATNGVGMTIAFGLGVGANLSGTAGSWVGAYKSSASSTVSILGTNAATLYITGVQLEAGTVATPFEHRSYGTELALCQRYAPIFNFSGSNQTISGSGFAYSTTAALINCTFPVQTRVAATGVTVTGTFNAYNTAGGNSGNFTGIARGAGNSVYSGTLNCTGGSGLTDAQGTYLLSPAGVSQIEFTGCEL